VKTYSNTKSLRTLKIYINIERAASGNDAEQEFHVKAASSTEEIKALLEVGFEYLCEKDEPPLFRKRK
jgi:hypothetical protein